MMNIKALLDLREKNNLNQTEMAKMLETSQSNYSRWEKGTEIIPLTKLNLLCNKFDVSMDYIMGLSKQNKKTDKIKLDKKQIGKNIKRVRKENKVTQVELSKLLNTTHSTISAYENGKTLILTVFAYQIAKTYNISLDKLCGKINSHY